MSGIISDESKVVIKGLPKFKFLSIYLEDVLHIIFIGCYDIIYTINKDGGCTYILFYNEDHIKNFKVSTQEELRTYFSSSKFIPFNYLYHIQDQIENKYKSMPFKFNVRRGLYTFELTKHTCVPINEHPTKSCEYILININHDNTFNIYDNDRECWMNSQKTIEYLYDNLYTTEGFQYIFYNY